MISFEMLSDKNVVDVWMLEKRCFIDPWTIKMFTDELDNKISVYIVARDDQTNSIVAYGGMWLIYDCADITNIAVAPEYRREGLGGRILELLEKIASEHNMTALSLEVRESNLPAIALYQKYGFLKNGLRKGYYKDNENAVLMTKNLKSSDNQ